MLERLLHKVLCKLGYHHYSRKPVIADLDGYWMQGGEKCYYCGDEIIDIKEAGTLAEYAYQRGKKDMYIAMTAYDGKYFNVDDHDVLPNTKTLTKH